MFTRGSLLLYPPQSYTSFKISSPLFLLRYFYLLEHSIKKLQNLLWKGGRGLPKATPAMDRATGNCPPRSHESQYCGQNFISMFNVNDFLAGGRRRENNDGISLVTFVRQLQQAGCENIRFSVGQLSEAGRLSVWLTWSKDGQEHENNLVCSSRVSPEAQEAQEERRLGDFLRTLSVFKGKNGGFFLGGSGEGEFELA